MNDICPPSQYELAAMVWGMLGPRVEVDWGRSETFYNPWPWSVWRAERRWRKERARQYAAHAALEGR